MSVAACAAWGGTINFNGTFSQDDNVVLFTYTVAVAGPVNVYTTSFTTDVSNNPTGGFSPILTVFDSTGQWLFDNSGFGAQTNASLTWVSDAGAQYIVALTEYDNYSIASGDDGNLSEGFVEAGNGNFTANPPFNPSLPGGFYDGTGGLQTTGDWAVTFTADDTQGLQAGEVPEPGPLSLAGAGLALILGCKPLRKRCFGKGQEA